MTRRYDEMAKRRVNMDKELAKIDEEQNLVKDKIYSMITILESQKDFNTEIIKTLETRNFLLREEHILVHRILIDILDSEILKKKNIYSEKAKDFNCRRDLIMINY